MLVAFADAALNSETAAAARAVKAAPAQYMARRAIELAALVLQPASRDPITAERAEEAK